jgi:hypothetical protein
VGGREGVALFLLGLFVDELHSHLSVHQRLLPPNILEEYLRHELGSDLEEQQGLHEV